MFRNVLITVVSVLFQGQKEGQHEKHLELEDIS